MTMRVTSARRFLLLILLVPGGIAAQQLPLKRDVPNVSWGGCPETSERPGNVTPAQRQDAERLAEAATQALLLGDRTAALDLLKRAAEADATSAAIAYRLARTLDELDRPTDALPAYCRFLALAPDAADAQEVRDRTRALGTPAGLSVAAAAAQAHETAIAHFDAGRLAEAETAFSQAIQAAPDWSAAVYNRALTRLAQNKNDAATQDLRRFLELSPGSPEFSAVLDLLATVRQTTPPYNPGSVLLRGLLVPGLGQFATGRTGAGIFYLGTASGALAAGFMLKRLAVDCLSVPVDGECPPGQIASEHEKRPYLVPAVAVALATGVFAAVDAYRGANRRNREAAASTRVGEDGGTRGASLLLPSINVGPRSAQLDLIRVRF